MAVPKLGPRARALIRHFESCKLTAYRCSAGRWTVGVGMTYYPSGLPVRPGDRITPAEADEGFAHLLARDFEPGVAKAIGDALTTPAQWGAMVALAYNIGVNAFAKSSVARLHKAGDHDGAARAFAAWNKERRNGVLQISAGLTRRRAAEAALYRGDFADLSSHTHGEVK